MKCPKCGYVSFDHLDNCKQCGRGLMDVKKDLNILSVAPETENMDELAAGLEVDGSDRPEMLGASGVFIQPDQGEEKTTAGIQEVTFEIEDEEEELVLEELSETEMVDMEDLDDFVLDEDLEEEALHIDAGLKEGAAEKTSLADRDEPLRTEAEPSINGIEADLEIPEDIINGDMSIGSEADTETLTLDASDIEVVDFELEDLSQAKKGSKGEEEG